jgi:Protein of unknown function (DUF3568)
MKPLVLRVLCLLLVSATASGCLLAAGAAGGAAGVIYVKGNVREYLDYTVPQVHVAAEKALTNEGLTLKVNKKDEDKVRIESEYADGKNIWVDIEPVTAEASYLTIRVGVAGDNQRSLRILNNIKYFLEGN